MVSNARADNFSFTGTFTQDDNVQLFQFTLGATSNVVLRTWSYAGGMNAAGALIPGGGFDPILALFDGSGQLLSQNDDGGCSLVPMDSVTDECWDTYLNETDLPAGSYIVSVMEYDNFAKGPALSNGFAEDGQGNFTVKFANGGTAAGCTQFIDATGDCRQDGWAFDILGVEDATDPSTSPVPEPPALILFGTGLLCLLGMALLRRRRGDQVA